MHRVTCQSLRVCYQGLKCGGLHRNISDAAVAWPKSSHRPSLIQMGRAGIIGTFLAGMCVLEWASLDNLKQEIVTTVLKVMFLTDEFRGRGDEGANGNRAERHEGELDARSSAAVVYHIHRQNPPCKLLSERRESLPFGQHLGRDTQKAR